MIRRRRLQLKEEEDIEPLSNYDILELAVKLKIPNFYGVFMRDTLPTKNPHTKKECWILNHGSSQTNGTHWTALARNYNIAYYFDSFGKLPPPFEVIDYLSDDVHIYYNVNRYQNYGTNICGHLCLKFLYAFWQYEKRKNV